MNFILNFLKGLLIGIGAITPGVSGGSLAVIFGLYEKITDFIANIFKNFKENFFFFLPVGIGGVVGVLGFSRIMEDYLLKNYNTEVKYLFIGLIIGTLPLVFNQANEKGFKKTYVLSFAIALLVTLIIAIFENPTNTVNNSNPGVIMLIICGGILGFGTIVPGISASFILMYLGAYETLLDSISNVDILVLIPVGIGFLLSIVLFAKLINMLFKHAYGYTYFAILGFVIGSIVPIFPGIGFSFKYLICIILFGIGFYTSYTLGKIKQ